MRETAPDRDECRAAGAALVLLQSKLIEKRKSNPVAETPIVAAAQRISCWIAASRPLASVPLTCI